MGAVGDSVNQIATIQEHQPPAVTAGFFDLQSFELMQRIAKGFASSSLVPQQYQGNVANTMIALSMAQRIGADPMAVMQQLYVVHGRPSWSSKFLIATMNACGRFTAMRFRFKGTEGQDDWACQAYATEKATGEEVNGSWVSIAMAKAEGWYGKNGSKWKTMPQQMLMYRAASFMVNIVAPELSMGLTTVEEAHDIIDVTPTRVPLADLNASLTAVIDTPAPTETIDTETGEVAPLSSFALDLLSVISDAGSAADLDACLEDAAELSDAERADVIAAAAAKRAELEAK